MTPPKIDPNVRKMDACFYCGKSADHSRDCLKEKFYETKCRNRRNIGHFVDIGDRINDDFQNLILHISNLAFSI
jgi:hypothetical protein